MTRWVYSKEVVSETKKPLREILNIIEKGLLPVLFIDTNLSFDYEIEIQEYDYEFEYEKSECVFLKPFKYWIQIIFFIRHNYNKKFVLATFYCDENFTYPLKIQENYLNEYFIEIDNELDLLRTLREIIPNSFKEMIKFIEMNVSEKDLKRPFNFEKVQRSVSNALNKTVLKKDRIIEKDEELYSSKKWTPTEKRIIINSIPSYRKIIDENNDFMHLEDITTKFALDLLEENMEYFEKRKVENLVNRIAYFEDLLAGVDAKYSNSDMIYFGKLKRVDGNLIKNKSRKW
jgi:hypothetical protein